MPKIDKILVLELLFCDGEGVGGRSTQDKAYCLLFFATSISPGSRGLSPGRAEARVLPNLGMLIGYSLAFAAPARDYSGHHAAFTLPCLHIHIPHLTIFFGALF